MGVMRCIGCLLAVFLSPPARMPPPFCPIRGRCMSLARPSSWRTSIGTAENLTVLLGSN